MKTALLGTVNTSTTVGAGDTQYLSALFEQKIGMGTNSIYVHCPATTGAPTAHTIAYEPITNIATVFPASTRTLTDVNPKTLAIYLGDSSPSAWSATVAKAPTAGECSICWMEMDIPWQGVRFTVIGAAGAIATVQLDFYIVYH